MADLKTFLPGIGFRRAGMRLAAPVAAEHGDRTLTVQQLVATSEATDLVYDVTWRPEDKNPGPPGSMDEVSLFDGSKAYGVGGGMSLSVRAGRIVRGFTMVPLPTGLADVELRVSVASIGDWNVPLHLVPFPSPSDGRYESIGASDSRHGVTVTVRGVVASSEATVLDLIALGDRPRLHVRGLGGLDGMRDASTALILRERSGPEHNEHFRQDARDRFPDPSGVADVAIFDALPDDAHDLVLECPFVCFSDPDPTAEIALPVNVPSDLMLGPHRVRVLASRQVEVRRGPHPPSPAIALDLDPRSATEDVTVIQPMQVKVDGEQVGFGFGGHGIYGPAPEPLKMLEVFQTGSGPPRQVTFVGVTVRARGPWRIPFTRSPRR